MNDPDIDAWLAAVEQQKSMKDLERKATEAFYKSLTPAQQVVLHKLALSGSTLFHLHSIIDKYELRKLAGPDEE